MARTLDVLANGLTSDGNTHLYIAAANSLDESSIVSETVQVLGCLGMGSRSTDAVG